VTQLRRTLSLFDATMVNVGVMIGSAVFYVAADVAQRVPSVPLGLLVWVVAAGASLAGALTIAELASAMPEAGGLYVYLSKAFGAPVGFAYGWALYVVIQTASIAAVAGVFASYLGHFVTLGPLGTQLVQVATITVLTGINILGVREGVWTQNILTVTKMAVMLGIVVLAFTSSHHHEPPIVSARPTVIAFGAALVGPLFAFDGWITTSYIGSEIKRPERNVPLVALASVALVALLYVSLNGAYLTVLGVGGVAASKLVVADTAQVLLGKAGAHVGSALVLVATFGALNGNIFGGARVFWAMAREKRFFAPAAQIHPRLRTPSVSLAMQGALSVAFVFVGYPDQLWTSVVLASWLFYGLGGVAVFVLRRRPELQRPYHVWGYPIVPIIFIAFAAALVANTIVSDPRDSLIGVGLMATAVPAYFFFSRKSQ
jgi:basic amino acid/polyamine antiporter, APA family